MATINGSALAVPQPKRYGKRSGSGYYSVLRWRGPKASVAALVPQLEELGYDYDVEEEPGPFATCTANVPTADSRDPGAPDGLVITKFQLVPNVVEKDILSSNISAVASLTQTDIQAIRKAIQDPGGGTALTAEALPLYKLMLKGVTAVRVTQPTFQHTVIVSNGYEVTAAVSNCGKILSSAKMVAETSAPPAFFPALAASPFTDAAADNVNMVSGWLKDYPTIENIAGGKAQITVQYNWGIWARLLYTYIP